MVKFQNEIIKPKSEYLNFDKLKNDSCKNLICYVKNKTQLSNILIKNLTCIDSVYFREDALFEADTIYNLNKDYSSIILDYNDGLNCTYKFILIINLKTNINTDCIIGFTDCDREGDSQYYSSSFSIHNNNIKIFKKYAPKGVDVTESKIIKTNNYTINDVGKLVLR